MQNNISVIKQNNQFDLGKLPPQNIELEIAVLAGIMLESEAFIKICDILKPESFYKDQHQKIYSACLNLFSNNKPIDILTVIEILRSRDELEEVGGMVYVTSITDNISSASHIEFHARLVQQKYIQREFILFSSKINNLAYDDSVDVQDLIDFSEVELFNISKNNVKKEPKHIEVIVKEQLIEIEKLSQSDSEFTGLPTGFTTLDRILLGLQNKKLIILAGRPGQGKTSFMISLARNLALDFKKKVAIFSLEMGEDELFGKLLSAETGFSYAKLTSKITNEQDWQKIEYSSRKLEDSDIFIDDSAEITIFELRAKARRLKMKHDIDIVMVDYLQLMTGGNQLKGNREQEVSIISRNLKIMAKELDIPVLALSQLNRSVEQRPNKRPQLSDLRESGAIEQDSDIVAFIHRPEYYGFMEDENQLSTVNRVDIIISKHRGGKLADVSLKRTPNFSKIYDIEEENIQDIQPLEELENNNDIVPDLGF